MPLSSNDIARLVQIARAAGERILPYFGKSGTQALRHKADHSPLTEADMAAHTYIRQALSQDFPGIAIISEEDTAHSALDKAKPFFLVDPLDGTLSFVRGDDEFTVNIALMEQLQPVFGVIAVPARDVVYWGGNAIKPMRQEGDAAAIPIHARTAPIAGLTVTRSRAAPKERAKAFLATVKVKEIIPASSALKFCWLAEGSADVYPRFGHTMEWDTAAGHAILNAAGGRITTADGAPLTYGKPGFENPGFIAWGAASS